MKKQDIISFFDRCASSWDANMIRSDAIIDNIMDTANIRKGIDVLDVACGTGVLFPDYQKREVGSLTAIDISPEMTKIARANYPEVAVICGDVEETDFSHNFDAIMIYNAFPHFPNPEHLIATLVQKLKESGTLTVAHGMSRAALQSHHSGAASMVSIELLHEDDLSDLFARCGLQLTTKISDDEKYIVSGVLHG